MLSIYERARSVFNDYAGMDAPRLPVNHFSALQVRLARWSNSKFGAAQDGQMVLGAVEEWGEAMETFLLLGVKLSRLSQAVLKSQQRIRGFADPEVARAAVADGVADASVFLIQLCTIFRLDYWTLLERTAEHVMKRQEGATPGECAP
jgi:hypothetical protein